MKMRLNVLTDPNLCLNGVDLSDMELPSSSILLQSWNSLCVYLPNAFDPFPISHLHFIRYSIRTFPHTTTTPLDNIVNILTSPYPLPHCWLVANSPPLPSTNVQPCPSFSTLGKNWFQTMWLSPKHWMTTNHLHLKQNNNKPRFASDIDLSLPPYAELVVFKHNPGGSMNSFIICGRYLSLGWLGYPLLLYSGVYKNTHSYYGPVTIIVELDGKRKFLKPPIRSHLNVYPSLSPTCTHWVCESYHLNFGPTPPPSLPKQQLKSDVIIA